MPCKVGIPVSPPPLPAFSIPAVPAAPDLLPGDELLCCKRPSVVLPLPPFPFPPGVITAAITSMTDAIDAVLAYINALPGICARE